MERIQDPVLDSSSKAQHEFSVEVNCLPKASQEMSHSGVDGLPKTLQELPDCELDQPCTDLHLCCIANEIIEWERIAPHLGIGAAEVREIQCDSKGYRQQKLTALGKWKNKHGTSSTYRNLIQIFHQLERQNIAIVQTESELDRPYSEADLALLANRLDDWEKVAAKMGITEAEKNEIQHDSASYWHEKYLALLKWRQKHGSRATMRKLIQILSELEEQITARSILAVHDDGYISCIPEAVLPTAAAAIRWQLANNGTSCLC